MIPADTTLHKRASDRSRALLALEAGERIELIADANGWLKVRARGRTGWIPQESLVEILPVDAPLAEPPPAEVATVETDPAEPVEEDLPTDEPSLAAEEPVRERTVEIAVTAGLSVITQGFRTAGSSTMADNYNIGVTAATFALGGGYVHRLREDVVVGAELAFAYHKALPGIRNTDPETGEAITTAFAIRDVGLRLVAGYDLQRPSGLVLLARVGVRHHLFAVTDVQDAVANPAMIPSEIQISPTIGVGLDVPRLASKLGVRLALDTFLAGTYVVQTPGQEDGTRADVAGAILQGAASYRWKPGLDLRIGYDVGIAKIDFGAPDPMSARLHGGTSVVRFDVVHRVTLGIAKGF